MFVDASAWVAVILNEPERDALYDMLLDAKTVLTSPIANWEAVRAIMREATDTLAGSTLRLTALQASLGVRHIQIGATEGEAAMKAHILFGKGVHAARLNMGDCFAYACAKVHDVPLLYKGNDFTLTDIKVAWRA